VYTIDECLTVLERLADYCLSNNDFTMAGYVFGVQDRLELEFREGVKLRERLNEIAAAADYSNIC